MFKRFRQNRKDEATRLANRETFLKNEDLIMPIFIVPGENVKEEISSMKDVYHYSIDTCLEDLKLFVEKGLQSILIFGVPNDKGVEQAYDRKGLTQNAISAIKEAFPTLEVIVDVCICSYTHDGHCHVGDNDKTCELLAEIALSYAEAGADVVAPSDMMDGRVHYIYEKLKANNLEKKVTIMSYAAKFSSTFYGPFRDAADCAPSSGNRKTYQMDYANGDEAIDEIQADINEGTTSIIVKPALIYNDITRRAKEKFDKEIVAYNVSGEYNMVLNMVESGQASEEMIFESLISMKRAGASRIITYFSGWILREGKLV